MTTWSAPGKVFLFGEHAVVYGKPGIAVAIQPRAYVTVRDTIHTQRFNSPYIAECFRQMNVSGNAYVQSQLPSSSGLGSSAAVTVATLCAINDEFNLHKNRSEIASIAQRVEMAVQRGHASATDTFVSAFGGMVLIRNNEKRRLLPRENLNIVIGNTGITHNTSDLVGKVAKLKSEYPDIVNQIMNSIEVVTWKAMYNMDNPVVLGSLMNINHSLMDALGVGHPMLSKLVYTCRANGAYGAKTTGAGGGGSMYALCPKNISGKIANAIEMCNAKAMITSIDMIGARKENER